MRERRVGSLALREWGDPGQPGVLLWPGLGARGAYWESLVGQLPFRAVAVDPPGLGGSAPLDRCSYERLVELACTVVERCDCHAIVGHSIGAYVAVGVATQPPAGLRAAMLIDGGYMEAAEMAELGVPVTADRGELVDWLAADTMRFPDWDTATREVAAIMSSQTPALEAYLREVFTEAEGEIRELGSPDQAADLLLATFDHEARILARRLVVPTLLVACGLPAGRRPLREKAWQAFAAGSPLVELHVADNWGHNPIFQDPEVFSTLAASWLQARVARSHTA